MSSCKSITNSLKLLIIFIEPTIPGLALPKAFEELEKQFDCVANVCRLKGSHESQTTGILLVCHELQRLLRLSFVGKRCTAIIIFVPN